MITVEQLIELAQEAETVDPIDWSALNIDENAAYQIVASQVIEEFGEFSEEQYLTLLACLVKLTVENFTLNLKLLSGRY